MSSIELVVEGVVRATDGLVNWYLVVDERGVLAIDAGLPRHWGLLQDALAFAGRSTADLRAVLLTHGHSDHTGFARRAQEELGAEVFVHSAEERLLRQPFRGLESERLILRYAGNASALRALFQMLAGGAARPTRLARWTPLLLDGGAGGSLAAGSSGSSSLEGLPGSPTILHTPGHTRGHCAVLLASHDVLVCGDALVTYDPYTGAHGPRLVARAATWDSTEARASLEVIAAAPARVVAPGHGEVWTHGAAEAARLARAAVHG